MSNGNFGKVKSLLKIAGLLNHSHLGSRNDTGASNCFGTTLYVLNVYDSERPRFVDSCDMDKMLWNCDEGKEELSVIGFFAPDGVIEHTGVYLGLKGGKDRMFHQPDVGHNFEEISVRDYVEDNKDLNPPVFYKLGGEFGGYGGIGDILSQ